MGLVAAKVSSETVQTLLVSLRAPGARLRGRLKWAMIGCRLLSPCLFLVPVSPFLVWGGSLPRETGLLP